VNVGKPILDRMDEERELPTGEEEEEKKPMTLWDMFMQYVKNKDKRERKQFIETVS
jgi:hypothetical protein